MNDADKTREQLLRELAELHQRVAELESAEIERQRVQEELKETEREKEQILDTLVEHVVYQDPNMKILWANQAACQSVGLSRDDIIGRYCYDVWVQRDEMCPDCPVRRCTVLGSPQECERVTPDGRVWHIRGYPVRGSDGQVIGAIEITLEVTARRRAEDALRQSEERCRTLIETTSDWVWEIDQNGVYTYTNPKVRNLLGYTPEEMLGKNLFDLIPPGEVAFFRTVFAQIIARQMPFANLEKANLHKNGKIVLLETSGVPLFDASGNLVGYRGIDRDVTERRDAQQRALDLMLQNERVRILSDFVEKASHEFRTPLSIINAKLYLARKTNEPEKREAHLMSIQEQSGSILDLVEGLVTMSRLDGSAEFAFRTCNLNGCIRDVCVSNRPTYDEKGIHLDLDLDNNLPPIQVDMQQISLALANILDNACRYTLPGGTITIRTYRQDGSIVVEFRDTGVGIAEADLPHVFERFYRGDSSHTTRGFGLGLPIASKIVDIHQGRIEVDSVQGEGSTFRIFLPIP